MKRYMYRLCSTFPCSTYRILSRALMGLRFLLRTTET